MEKETEQKIQQLSLLEQNMQNTSVQKQGFHVQLLEVESALEELEKIVSGNSGINHKTENE